MVNAMTKVELIEEEIKKLAPEELAQLRDWLMDLDAQLWDKQIEQDAASGKLDKLLKEAAELRSCEARGNGRNKLLSS